MINKQKINILCLLNLGLHPKSKKLMPNDNDIATIAFSQKIAKYYQNHNKQSQIYYLNFLTKKYHQNNSYYQNYQNALKDYFAYGIRQIYQLKVKKSDFIDLIQTLINQWQIEILITSTKANSGFASGLLTYQIAKSAQFLIFNNIIDFHKLRNQLQLEQFLPSGFRRKLNFKDPSVINIHPNCTLKKPYIYADIAKGKIIELDEQNYQTTAKAIKTIQAKNSWQKLKEDKPKIAFKIEQKITANQRMDQFVSNSNLNNQTKIIKNLTVEQKIDEILSVLKSYQLFK